VADSGQPSGAAASGGGAGACAGGAADALADLLRRHRQMLGRAALPGPVERARWWLRRLRGDRAMHLSQWTWVISRSLLFDAQWYLRAYPDVAAARLEPARHYAEHGCAEGRDPGPWFSSAQYWYENPDVAAAGLNALVHYETHGLREGRGLPTGSAWMARHASPAGAVAESSRMPKMRPAALLMPGALDINTPAVVRFKADFRRDCEAHLSAFLASGRRLRLPEAAAPRVSVVLVLYNQAELTLKCLESLQRYLPPASEVILVDNCSTDATRELLGRVDGAKILPQTENLHFLRGANAGAAHAAGQYVLFLNNDAALSPGAVLAAAQVLDSQDDAGVVGARVVQLDGRLQEAGHIVWRNGGVTGYGRGCRPDDAEFLFRRDVDSACGAFLMIRRTLFEQLGGFDTAYVPAYYEDVDLCIRVWQAGFRVVYEPAARIEHYEFGSADSVDQAQGLAGANHLVFLERHRAYLETAPLPESASLPQVRMRRPRGGRVLMIDDAVPLDALGSGFPRARILLHDLHPAGAFVTLFPMSAETVDFEEAYKAVPREVEIIDGGRLALGDFLRERAGCYDVILVSRPHNMDWYCRVRPPAQAAGRPTLVYDAEALIWPREAARARLGVGAAPPADAAEREFGLARAADIVLAVSEAEAESFRRVGCVDVRVLGHAVQPEPGAPGFAGRQGILFVGRLLEEESPNVDSIRWFVREVMPLLDRIIGDGYRLDLVGACAPGLVRDLGSERVRFHGRVEDLRDHYARARLFIAPTRFAAGLPLKVTEAAAHGVPLVATTLIAAQAGWRDGVELLQAGSADQFAAACARLYGDAGLWQSLRDAALERVRRDYSRPGFAGTVRGMLADALVPRRGGLGEGALDRVQTEWSIHPDARRDLVGMNWLQHEEVIRRLNRKVSGDPQIDPHMQLRRFLAGLGWRFPLRRVASLGCGFGIQDRAVMAAGFARRLDGYDITQHALAQARRAAERDGLEGLHYHEANLDEPDLPEGVFDVVLGYHSIHHVANLDGLFAGVRRSLRPGGIFHLVEYVGPDRFQFPDRCIELINEYLDSLPPGYGTLLSGAPHAPVRRPSAEMVMAADPSEAVNSAAITASVARHFRVLVHCDLGGALMHHGLSGIAQNFRADDPVAMAHLQRFFDLEDRMLAAGEIGSDFAVITAIRDLTPEDGPDRAGT
jgi:GT2 family glycosyltransferase/SAM-dependent methyltransferase